MHKELTNVLLAMFFFCFWLPLNSHAQLKAEASVGYLLPMGELKHNYAYGLQGTLGVSYAVRPDLQLFTDVGYSFVKGVHIEDHYLQYTVSDLRALPFNLGLRYHLDQIFFIGASGGPMWMINQDWQTGWQYSAFVGARYHHFSLSGKLTQWNKSGIINFAGLQLSYLF